MPRLSYLSAVSVEVRKDADDIAAALDELLGAPQEQWRLTINAPPDRSYVEVVLRGDRAGKEIVLPHRFEGITASIDHIVTYYRAALAKAGVELPRS